MCAIRDFCHTVMTIFVLHVRLTFSEPLGDCHLLSNEKGKIQLNKDSLPTRREVRQVEVIYKIIPLGLWFLTSDRFGKLILDPRGKPKKSQQEEGALSGKESVSGLFVVHQASHE